MKAVVVHDAFVQAGGGERVAAEIARALDDARLLTSAWRPEFLPVSLSPERVRSSFVQPLVRRGVPLPALAALLPAAFGRLDPGPVDVVVSSSSAFAHHVRIPPGAAHLCYCHTPPRFLWDGAEYFHAQPLRRVATSPGRAVYRSLDLAAAARVDLYVANSRYVAARIRRVYGRDPVVVYPPVDTSRFRPATERSGRFLVVSRLRNQKRVDLAVEAANLGGLPLDVVGDGVERPHLERLAGPTIRFLGRLGDDEVRYAMARCAGVLVPAIQDFGLTVVEAQASGRPPIAFAAGGSLEIVDDGRTGFLFGEQTPAALAAAMQRALEVELPAEPLLASARRFDVERFGTAIRHAAALAIELRRAGAAATPDGRRPQPAVDAVVMEDPASGGTGEWQEPAYGA